MRLIEFTPGDGRRYFVGVASLTPEDARPLGGDHETVLIVFGGEKQMHAATFQRSPGKHGHLTEDYLGQYLSGLDYLSLRVAHHIVAALLGREAIFAKRTPEQMGWDAGWQNQLAPLLADLIGTGAECHHLSGQLAAIAKTGGLPHA